MRAHRLISFLLLFTLILTPARAAERGLPAFVSAPSLVKPGQYAEFVVDVPTNGLVSLTLLSEIYGSSSTIMSGYPVEAGENKLYWNGVLPSYDSIPVGEYTLRLQLNDGPYVDTPVRIGVPYPQLTGVQQSGRTLVEDNLVTVTFQASAGGTLFMQLFRYEDDTIVGEASLDVVTGENSFRWNGMLDGTRVPEGEYALILSLRSASGEESMQHYVYLDVQAQSMALVDFDAMTQALLDEIAPSRHDLLSRPYGLRDDGSFWAMHPGELDDAAIWEIMQQPIVVYDDGKISSMGHTYMAENPDGSGERIAQIHGLSQGIHVLGEPNEYGYVFVETFSNFDPSYNPTTPEEKANAFNIRRGYLPAEHLKTVEVEQDIGLLVDKLTQRMYIFIDGMRVTELTISTGKRSEAKYFRETIPGEFITVGHSGGFWSNDLYCALSIRINGGTLIHETPHTVGADGTKYYGVTEPLLGTKASGNCIRVPRKKNPEGYNQTWIWRNLDGRKHYKVLIWDDLHRVDAPTVWR